MNIAIMLKEGDTVRLLVDKSSVGKARILYGQKGDTVKIISVSHYPVLIVDNKEIKFPIAADNISKL